VRGGEGRGGYCRCQRSLSRHRCRRASRGVRHTWRANKLSFQSGLQCCPGFRVSEITCTLAFSLSLPLAGATVIVQCSCWSMDISGLDEIHLCTMSALRLRSMPVPMSRCMSAFAGRDFTLQMSSSISMALNMLAARSQMIEYLPRYMRPHDECSLHRLDITGFQHAGSRMMDLKTGRPS